jgi:hypothetical protein
MHHLLKERRGPTQKKRKEGRKALLKNVLEVSVFTTLTIISAL